MSVLISPPRRGSTLMFGLGLALELWTPTSGWAASIVEPEATNGSAEPDASEPSAATSATRPEAGDAPPSKPSPDDPAAKRFAAARAKAAIERARAAAKAQDYQEAIRQFETALAHQPSAKLHFNLGACHHRLMMSQAAGSPAYEQHRGAAVDAYNRYLEAAPQAEDAQSVAEMITALGGTPYSAEAPEPWTIELVEPESVPDPPKLVGTPETKDDEPPEPPPDLPPEGPTPPPPDRGDDFPRWGLSFGIPVVWSSPGRMAQSDELSAAPHAGLSLGGNAYLGARRGLFMGGEMALITQTITANARHKQRMFYLNALFEVHRRLKDERLEIGAGGSAGVSSQTLVFNGDPIRCAATQQRDASTRAGFLANARVYLAMALGPRRRHAVFFRAGPGLGFFGGGSYVTMDADGQSCSQDDSAFELFGVESGAALTVHLDIGYSPRF